MSDPAAAAREPISGRLSESGYTVVALADHGRIRKTVASRGRFRLRSPATRVTLHLRAPSGTYAGPIVVGRNKAGRRAIVGVREGARLGTITVRRGYAKVTGRLRAKWVDSSRLARARNGVPIGATAFGRVRSKPPRKRVPGDTDFDGVPNPLDIDDDGDLILDSSDPSRAARAAQQPLGPPGMTSSLELPLTETVNANHPALAGQIEGTFLGKLIIGYNPAFPTELDCGRDNPGTPQREGLVYCSTGDPPSKGLIFRGPGQPAEAFPQPCCDSDNGGAGDGFGRLVTTPSLEVPVGSSMVLRFSATTAEIQTGQKLIWHLTTAGDDESACPPPPDAVETNCASFTGTLQYIFATVPTLISYDDGAGNARTVSYPVPRGCPPPGPCSGFGTPEYPFPVKLRNGRFVLTLTFWRPQRRPIEGEPGWVAPPSPPVAWTDIGRLVYSAEPYQTQTGTGTRCPQSAYSFADDQPFALPPPPGPVPRFSDVGLWDTRLDSPADPGNTLTYTLDLSDCFAGRNWQPGDAVALRFRATGLSDPTRPDYATSAAGYASQNSVAFQLQD